MTRLRLLSAGQNVLRWWPAIRRVLSRAHRMPQGHAHLESARKADLSVHVLEMSWLYTGLLLQRRDCTSSSKIHPRGERCPISKLCGCTNDLPLRNQEVKFPRPTDESAYTGFAVRLRQLGGSLDNYRDKATRIVAIIPSQEQAGASPVRNDRINY